MSIACVFVYDMPEEAIFSANQDESCSTSSIGRNSDENDGDGEVQSRFRGPLDTMDALQDALPVRRGISKFYHGRSRSFTSLGDTLSSSSMKDLAKPENGFRRKRKSFMGYNKGISKRPAVTSKCLPPLYPQGRRCLNTGASSKLRMGGPWRSFSLSDIQCLPPSGCVKYNYGEQQERF